MTASGDLAATPHPAAYGSKLTHPHITTDFSEAQLELITGVQRSAAATLEELALIHRVVHQGLDDELLWAASMPCMLGEEASIPLAYFGQSNLGRLKTSYRSGLGLRYGRAMQTISAVHYNFSLSDELWDALQAKEGGKGSAKDYRTKRYFDLMRNFRRYGWLLLYLFGASPAVCNSFLRGRRHGFKALDEGTAYLPYATSLRSGSLGYQSDTQAAELDVCYNSLEGYVGSLASAISQPYPAYAGRGEQLNENVLQSEAEFYSSIRAKRVPGKGENSLRKLLQSGVEYLEVRLLDVNPYSPLGLDETDINFLDVFLTYCLLKPSPPHDEAQCRELDMNAKETVLSGRDPALRLADEGRPRQLREWGLALVADLLSLAEAFDAGGDTHSAYSEAVRVQQAKLQDSDLTPSGRMLKEMAEARQPFFRFAMALSLAHRQALLAEPPSPSQLEAFARLREESLAGQAAMEAAVQPPYDDYLRALQSEYVELAAQTMK